MVSQILWLNGPMRVPGATRYVMDTENGKEQGGGPALAQSHVINPGNGRTWSNRL